MSKPNTRSKNKRHKNEDSDDHPSEILRRIHFTGEITHDDVFKLYSLNKPICQGCRVNTKDNPNCFCALIPTLNGTRKTGLWQRLPDIIQSLGPNPFKDLRSSPDKPAGLTNLGATCYANSILQCLYMNTQFRSRMFSVEYELLKQHPVLDQLVRLFAQLHSSKMAFIDSAPFIKTLELDNGVQQDSHEFLTLFLSLLERSLVLSEVSGVRSVVQDLFRGSVSHVTRCSTCGQDSEASSKMEDFYELELNIKGLKNLDESLDDYLSLERLDGENQYFCESCSVRVDATRSIKLRSLPSVLNFQLKRYVFLPKTTTKKKITSSYSFPRQLDMGKRICNPSESGPIYELSAILIHKGATANSGHYVAHIKDENSGQWWEFDDEHVSNLGSHPFGEDASAKVKSSSNGNHNSKRAKVPVNGSCSQKDLYSSTDAYMLMYNCVNAKEDGDRANITKEVVDMDVDVKYSPIPHYLEKEMQDLNASYDSSCQNYQEEKDKQLAFVTERRNEVKLILSEAPVRSPEDSYFWISTEWLRQWADNLTPSCVDNSSLQCIHGKVPFSKVPSMKRVSEKAWNKLFSRYEGGPSLSNSDNCIDCLKDGATSAVSADDYRDTKNSLRHLAEASLTGTIPDEPSYYVSRTWLSQWLRRKNVDSLCDADAGPTASLRCTHGDLLPEIASGAKRVLVPEVLWQFILENANKVKPDDSHGSATFTSDSIPCDICTVELTEVASLEDSQRAAKQKQRQNHEKLILGKNFTLSSGCKYFLVPSSWLTKWRAFVTTSGRNKCTLEEPENLQVIMDSLLCPKHSRLLERPLELVCKRGVITQRMSNTDGLTLISELDWELFCEEWDVQKNKGINAEIDFRNSGTSKLAGSSEEMPVSGGHIMHYNEEAEDELAARKPFVKTIPEVCDECIGERESCQLVQKLNYCNENISVYLVHGKEAPRSIIEASAAVPEPDRRISKRSRRTTSANSISLTVSGSTTIYELKMMIWEAFGVVKENQKIHKGNAEIEGDLATLADKNIFPGDLIWVKDTEIHENRDIADELQVQKAEQQHAEEGFRGTLLTSNIAIEAFQKPPLS